MAQDVDLTWNETAMAGATDIDSLKIYYKVGDHTAVTDMEAFRTGATEVADVALGTGTYKHLNVPAETYTYGIFSYNASGCGPGDLSDMPLIVN
jgi:hypothetical protein